MERRQGAWPGGSGRADLVTLGRELPRPPYWPQDAARKLGHEITWPRPCQRARLA